MRTHPYLNKLIEQANSSHLLLLRLREWSRTIRWEINGEDYYWSTKDGKLSFAEKTEPDFTLQSSNDTLQRIVEKGFPFFMAIWGTGEIQFDCSFGDAYRLGYIFMRDKRKRRVLFISHCWLNINTRFPEGAAFEGSNTALIKTIIDEGIGIIQMPCPEYHCLGLEKYNYGIIAGDELKACFRGLAEGVVEQIKDYLALGFDVVGVLGMNPSPSCGVDTTKGRGTMEGTDRDTSEKPGPGIFIDELQQLLANEGLDDIHVFGVRRLMPEESGIENRIEDLKRGLHRKYAFL